MSEQGPRRCLGCNVFTTRVTSICSTCSSLSNLLQVLEPGIRDVSSLVKDTEESITRNLTIVKAPNDPNRDGTENYSYSKAGGRLEPVPIERSMNLKGNTHIASKADREGMSELINVIAIGSDGETPNDRFIRLSGKRLTSALESIRLLGNLANTAHYDYSGVQVADIVNALLEANVKLERLFRKGSMAGSKTTRKLNRALKLKT